MIRCFVDSEAWREGPLALSGKEARHLGWVLRVRPGDPVTLFDGRGREAEARVSRVGAREVLLEVGPARSVPAADWTLTLAAAVPGNVKMDEIVNQAAQLGAGRIIPLLTERTVARLSPERWGSRQGRLERIAVEAAKQCGAARVPSIDTLTRWRDLLSSFPDYRLVLMASVEGPHEPLAALLAPLRGKGRVLILIGPEGDFTPGETRQAADAGARRFSLGPAVLRCETAAAAALSVVAFLLRQGGKFSRLHP